jgi:ssDNA thymidine ADP-ribosyltransferase, DarT
MAAPVPTRLFHITAIANLPAICAAGALVSKNGGAAQGVAYQNIAHAGAQGARAGKRVPNPPGGPIHDYVPFYFAPRSPMLSAIHAGRVVGCDLKQEDIVHLETTVQRVTAAGEAFVFYDRNATLAFSTAYTNLADLSAVAWDILTEAPQLDGFCKYFMNQHQNVRYADRMEKRQAEFLVRHRVPLAQITRVGVATGAKAAQVQGLLATTGVSLPVVVQPDWYFLGQ